MAGRYRGRRPAPLPVLAAGDFTEQLVDAAPCARGRASRTPGATRLYLGLHRLTLDEDVPYARPRPLRAGRRAVRRCVRGAHFTVAQPFLPADDPSTRGTGSPYKASPTPVSPPLWLGQDHAQSPQRVWVERSHLLLSGVVNRLPDRVEVNLQVERHEHGRTGVISSTRALKAGRTDNGRFPTPIIRLRTSPSEGNFHYSSNSSVVRGASGSCSSNDWR